MFWIVATVILVGLALLTFRVRFGISDAAKERHRVATETAAANPSRYGNNVKDLEATFNDEKGGGPRIVAVPLIAIWLIITLFASINTIDAGQIGLVRTFGKFTGQQSAGINFKAPYQGVTKVDGKVLKHSVKMNGGDNGSAFSKETQPVFSTIELNYQLDLAHATKLYSDVGENYYSRIIEPRVQQAFKAETVKYDTIDIAPSREKIRSDVRDTLESQLKPYGINILQITIRDIEFGDKFMAAIEDKQAATQQALAAQAKVAIAQADARSKIATAKGDADAIAIKANALKSNPQALAQQAIEKLNPNVQIMVVPQNSPLLQLPQFKAAGVN